MAKKSKGNIGEVQSEKEKALSTKIQDRYRASFLHKESLGMNELWSTCEDYWAGDVNKPEDEDDPGSETNIIQPIIESQVADLVGDNMEISVFGTGPSDYPFADDMRHILKWVWHRNKMTDKLDEGERDRTNLGTVGWKVYWDPDALNGRGMPVIEPCSPDTLFPDPKIKDPRKIQMGDFFIHVMPYPLGALKRRFGDRAKLVQPEGNFTSYDPRIFGEAELDSANDVVNDQALLFEYWEKDDDDKLRRVYMAGDIILDDSDWDHSDKEGRESFYKHGKYPFVIIPCYKRKGRLWGMGDTEQLIPTQDMINDLDDQIRMNARLMGNVQMVVGLSAGINVKKWTNKPGLKIPAKDHTAWQTVQPATIPSYIYTRRQQGFTESQIVSGRSDVTEGRQSGSLRAASAIMALQEAGSRRANHKKLMLQQGFVEVLELVTDYVEEFMDVEQAFDITENGKVDYLWFRGTKFNDIPVKTMNENFNPLSDDKGTERFKDLYDYDTDEEGNQVTDEVDGQQVPHMKLMTKKAEFDLTISFGAGMPNNPSFVYQSTLELHRENIVTQEEARQILKQVLNFPVIDPWKPRGTFAGRNNSAEQLAVANGNANGMTPFPSSVPSGNDSGQPEGQPQGNSQQDTGQSAEPQQLDTDQAVQMFMTAVDALPPQIIQQLLAQLGSISQVGASQGGAQQ